MIDGAQILGKTPSALQFHQACEEAAQLDPVAFCLYYRKLKGKPFFFDMGARLARYEEMFKKQEIGEIEWKTHLLRHRPFLVKPLRDRHPHKVYRKARQMGVSEIAISEVLWFLKAHPKTKYLFTFPREKQLEDFSNTRIQEAFGETPRMASLKTGINQVLTKKIGESFLILRSAWESNLGEGVDADGLTFDEKDRMRPGIDAAFLESLQSSPWKLFREVSTPSLPGRGVDENFQKSDQQYWFVKCEKCGMKQPISYPENILQLKDVPPNAVEIKKDSFRYACAKPACRGPLNRLHGEWVAKHPDRERIRGYQLSQLQVPWLEADDIEYKRRIQYRNKGDQPFFNYVLGLPSAGTTKLVSRADIETCVAGHKPITMRTKAWNFIAVGIDWGHLNWVFVLGQNAHNNKLYMLDIRTFEDQPNRLDWVEKDLVGYLQAFEPNVIIADGGYGKDRNAVLMKAFNTYQPVAYACDYNTAGPRSRTHKPVWADASARVLVDRNTEIKRVCNEIRQKRVGFCQWDQERMEFLATHFTNLAPLYIEEEGQEPYEDIDRIGPDHLVHAMVYANLGMGKLLEEYSGFGFYTE